MVKVLSTRAWEKKQIIEFIENYIAHFAMSCDGQVNLAAPSAQKSLAVALANSLEEKGYLS